MGISVENGEFAIVGGTGQFAMASGVIYKNFHEQRSDGNIIRLTIQGSSPLLKGWSPPPVRENKYFSYHFQLPFVRILANFVENEKYTI
jgi:hypothetical protein